tara:strand:+ start:956 stop:1429 length:474 start_codon:yes stop_codon:yes gene_type:complete
MSILEKLREMNLPADTPVRLSYSQGADVFVHNETEVETALEYTDVISTFAELIATPGLKVQSAYGDNILESFRDQGLLDDYERDGTFEDYLAETVQDNFYDQEFIEYSTEKYDYKRGFTTLSADVVVELGNLLENAFWVSSGWEVSVKTDSGTLTLD